MKVKIGLVPLLALLISACAALGVPPADTFNKRVILANGIVEQASATIEALTIARKISKPEAASYNERAREAASAIDVAREIRVSDPAAADARLTAIIRGLHVLNAELQRRQSAERVEP